MAAFRTLLRFRRRVAAGGSEAAAELRAKGPDFVFRGDYCALVNSGSEAMAARGRVGPWCALRTVFTAAIVGRAACCCLACAVGEAPGLACQGSFASP